MRCPSLAPSRPGTVAMLLVATFAAVTPAGATTADDLCPPATNPCVIASSATITDGSVLDFGDRDVVVNQGRVLEVGFGAMVISARSLVLAPKAKLLATGGGLISVQVTGSIDLQRAGSDRSRIDVSGDFGGGVIELLAGDDVLVNGDLVARSILFDADGGEILIGAGSDVTVNTLVDIGGGSDGSGGALTVIADGAVTFADAIFASGGEFDGGEVDISAGGHLSVDEVDISGGSLSGSGGALVLQSAAGNITLNGQVLGTAGGSLEEGGGFGGSVDAVAPAGNVTVLGRIRIPGADAPATAATSSSPPGRRCSSTPTSSPMAGATTAAASGTGAAAR